MEYMRRLSPDARERVLRTFDSDFFIGIVDTTLNPCAVKDAESKLIIYANEPYANLFGKNPEEIVGLRVQDYIQPHHQARFTDSDRIALESGRYDRVDEFVFDGRPRVFRVAKYPVKGRDGRTYLFCVLSDLTWLHAVESQFRQTQKIAQIGSAQYDLRSRLLSWSEESFRLFGFEPGSIEPSFDAIYSVIHPDDRALARAKIQDGLAGLEPRVSFRYRIVRDTGEIRWLAFTAELQRLDGEPVQYIGTNQDVTDFIASEERRQSSEKSLSELVTLLDDVWWTADLKTRQATFVSPAAERVYGLPLALAYDGGFWAKHGHPDDVDGIYLGLREAVGAGGGTIQFRFNHPEKGERVMVTRVKVLYGPDGTPEQLMGMTHDATEQKQAEIELEQQKLRQFAQSKINTLADLASGIGHEINTPLTALMSKIGRIQRESRREGLRADGTGEPSLIPRLCDESLQVIERMSDIVQGLKNLSAKHDDDYGRESRANPLFVLNQAFNLTRARFSNQGIRIEVDYGLDEEASVRCSDTHLFQVYVNLLNNAFDAIVSTGGNASAHHFVRVETRYRNGRASLSFSDSGPGIAPHDLPRLFQPYFTTKSGAGGTGLGLSISRRILRGYGGDLLHDARGDETRFTIELPLAEARPERSEAPRPPETSL